MDKEKTSVIMNRLETKSGYKPFSRLPFPIFGLKYDLGRDLIFVATEGGIFSVNKDGSYQKVGIER